MRCGFCNLFTTVDRDREWMERYVTTLERQANRVKAAFGGGYFARFALGGGTPTQLPSHAIESILNIAEETMGADLRLILSSVEVSPQTVDKQKFRLLRDRSRDRLSIGVQSFIDSEVLAIQCRQTA